MTKRTVPGIPSGLMALMLFFAGTSPAQTASATISGRVNDSAAAVIPGAIVDMRSLERGTIFSLRTNEAGIFVFAGVAPGHYAMTAKREGFKQAEVADLQVEVGSRIEQNFQLEVGSVRESVTVEAAEPLVNTVSATVSSVVSGNTVQDLPLNGRDTLQLALTQPGVTPMTIRATGFAGNGFSIAGSRANSTTYMLDGGVNNSVANGTAVVNPNPDTVAEFRILTNNYSAEYGRSNGGIVNVVTKSGTNTLHGTAYDYLRNKALNANNFFNQATPGAYSPVPTLIRNQFGVTAGGPLTVPHVINGKDRLFWFMGYQGQREISTRVGTQVRVFTPDEIKGDFSRSNRGSPDAGVIAFLQSHPYYQGNPQLAGQAIIDPSRINPVAQAYIKSEPIPVTASGILTPQGAARDNRDEFLGKTDFNFTPNQRFSVTLVRNHNPLVDPLPSNIPGYSLQTIGDQYFVGLQHTSVLSPTLLNEAHFTLQRLVSASGTPAQSLPTSLSLGLKITPDLATGPPIVNFGVAGMSLGYPGSVPGYYADTSYIWSDNLSWTRGRHTMKFGGIFSILQNNGAFGYQTNGNFTFSGPTGAGGIGSGNDLADFLFGAPNNYQQFPNAFSSAHGHQYGVFAHDEWKIRSNLTLTLGVRYEYNSPKWDPQGRNYMIIPGLQSKQFPGAPLGLVFPCDPGAPCPGVYYPDKNNFAPRLGFAWDPQGRGHTSIRGGAGVFFDTLTAQDIQWQNGTPPFYAASTIFFNASQVPAGGPTAIFSDPYGATGSVNPFPSQRLSSSTDFRKAGFIPFGPGSVLIDPNQRNPYTYGWNLTLQQSLGAGLGLQVAYVGSASHKLILNMDPNSFFPGTLIRPYNLQPGLQIPNSFAQMGVNKTIGSASYEGLLSSITKRMSNTPVGPAFFTLAWTYAKTLSDQDAYLQNVSNWNSHQFHGPAAYDIRSRIVMSGGWELPFNKLWSHGPKAITEGWSLYPIFSTQSAQPIDFNSGISRTSTNPGPAGDGAPGLVRPNWGGGSQEILDPHQVQTFTFNGRTLTGRFFFNPTPLSTPACYTSTAAPGTPGGCPTPTYGTLQRNTLRGLPITNFDLSLEKKTRLPGEKAQLLFRAEFFNVLNHTEFLTPNLQVSVRSALVGQSTSTNPARIGQLALKLIF